ISWSELQHGYSSRRIDPAQRGAIAALLQAHRARTSQWYGVAEVIGGDGMGAALWPLLRDVEASGVPLVTGHQGRVPVHLRSEPIDLALDLTRDTDGQLRLHPVLDLPGASSPVLLGNPGHGLMAQERTELHLAALRRPLTPALTNLISTGELVIPAPDADRFL